MKLIAPLALVGLAACAPMRPANQFSDVDICRFTLRGGQNAMTAQNEANRRGLDCRTLYPAIIAKDQADAAALNSAARYFQPAPMQPMPPMIQPQTNCTSRVIGNTVQTSCQ